MVSYGVVRVTMIFRKIYDGDMTVVTAMCSRKSFFFKISPLAWLATNFIQNARWNVVKVLTQVKPFVLFTLTIQFNLLLFAIQNDLILTSIFFIEI